MKPTQKPDAKAPPPEPRAGISRRRPPIAADRANARHLRAVSRRPGVTQILSRLPDAVVSFDREWRYVYMNRQAELNHEQPASDFIGHVVWDLYPEGKDLLAYRQYQQAMESQKESVFDEYVPMLGRWFEQRLFPSADGLTVIARDISEWREVRREQAELPSDLPVAVEPALEPARRVSAAGESSSSEPTALRTFTTFFARPGERSALLAYLQASEVFSGAVRDAGVLAIELQSADDPTGPVVITALWRGSADYERWQVDPTRAQILADLEPLVEEICVDRYEVLRRTTA